MAEFIEVMKHKKRMCNYYKDKCACEECPMNSGNNELYKSCTIINTKYPEKAEEIIMQWACEHPIKTNADKFKEIINEAFGEGIVSTYVTGCYFVKCPHPELICDSCEYRNFWDKEYKEPKKEDK